jgi:glc operon protein GlcG
MRAVLTLITLVCITASSAFAELATKKTLTIDDAKRVSAAAVAEAKKGAGTAAIAVVDDGGNLMLVERLDNTFAAGANISIGKARTAALFKKPTSAFENLINKGRTAMASMGPPDFTPLQGGVPIIVDGQIVGAIGVSGAASAQQDEEVAIAGTKALSGGQITSVSMVPEVRFFDASSVMSSFAKGAVLFDGAGGNFQIHTSRRDVPGQAEVHTKEADVIYVQDGEATFVTGGTAIDLKQTATDEFRGARIDGGDTHTLAKGDVIVVPAGVPHWFKEIRGEFHYYVVKVS